VPALGFCVIAMIPQSRLLILNPTHTFRGVVVASLAFFGCGAQENGGILADSAIPCSSIITYGPRQSAQQLHRSVHPLDPIARVATSLRASLNGIPASTSF
jgi:hypothetical protein